ncbi:tyrosine-type recombinase/integrase [Enterobacter roggenkampii]|uniref:tyrosine-type recombinase/integrase n=1 Tax=Enterobacter roggenkampii TaxID=1812935 RepID=UPI001C706886|nr:tyrosine-type recombinase/integrase [Enterobacter roggenkampii]MBW9467651.1 tyrosine-type recombinase/integrase [Enterobacter roggenkampii]
MAINKKTEYLFQLREGTWMFQIFIPVYMRHLFSGKRLWRRSTGTRDVVKARIFRDHLLLEFNQLREKYRVDTSEVKLRNALAELNAEVSRNADRPKLSTPYVIPTLRFVCDQYERAFTGKRTPATLGRAQWATTKFLESIKREDIQLDRIGRRMVSLFIEEQTKGGQLALSTLQNWIISLATLYKYARQNFDALSPDNPFNGHGIDGRGASIESYQPFEIEQLQVLMSKARRDLKDLILFSLYSGMRLNEIASLKHEHIVTIEGVRCFHIPIAKSKAGKRDVPCHSRLIDIVDRYLSQNHGQYLFPQSNNVTRKDGRPGALFSSKFSVLKSHHLPDAGDRQCFHSLRGMFITQLDRAGLPENRIAQIVGHSRGKTESLKTYSKGAEMKELQGYVEMVSYPELEKGL